MGQDNIFAGCERYLDSAFGQIDQRHAKRIMLFLAKYSGTAWSRKEIRDYCGLQEMSDLELEQKLRALVAGELIAQGTTLEKYQGLGDPMLEQVFRLKYEEETKQTDFGNLQGEALPEQEQKIRRLKLRVAAETEELNKVRNELKTFRKMELAESLKTGKANDGTKMDLNANSRDETICQTMSPKNIR